jgi:hypothetical protein
MVKTFSVADVAAHNKPNDLYIVVDEDVYDLTTFQDEHPGKPSVPSFQALSPFTRQSPSHRPSQLTVFVLQVAKRFSRESLARTHPSNSGSITMRAS